jgi:hypothetical protein
MIICPQCGYERTKNDDGFVSSEECPKCGIFYKKWKPSAVSNSMETKNNKNIYSKSAQRDLLYVDIFMLLLGLFGIIMSIHDFANDQFTYLGRHSSSKMQSRAEHPVYFWVSNLISFAFGIFLTLFSAAVLFSRRKKMKTTVTEQIESLKETYSNERVHMNSAVNKDTSLQELRETPLALKVFLGVFMLLMLGVDIFVVIIFQPDATSTEKLGLVLTLSGAAWLVGVASAARASRGMGSIEINKNGQITSKRLTVVEQIFVVLSIISLCAGTLIYYFVN